MRSFEVTAMTKAKEEIDAATKRAERTEVEPRHRKKEPKTRWGDVLVWTNFVVFVVSFGCFGEWPEFGFSSDLSDKNSQVSWNVLSTHRLSYWHDRFQIQTLKSMFAFSSQNHIFVSGENKKPFICEDVSVPKQKKMVFNPMANEKKYTLFSFFLWWLDEISSFFSFVLLGEQLSWSRNILTNVQNNSVTENKSLSLVSCGFNSDTTACTLWARNYWGWRTRSEFVWIALMYPLKKPTLIRCTQHQRLQSLPLLLPCFFFLWLGGSFCTPIFLLWNIKMSQWAESISPKHPTKIQNKESGNCTCQCLLVFAFRLFTGQFNNIEIWWNSICLAELTTCLTFTTVFFFFGKHDFLTWCNLLVQSQL